jgi:PPOX class probable F420-dependent enzyme
MDASPHPSTVTITPEHPESLDPTARRLLAGANMAHLASLLPDGSPHAVPVWVDPEGDRVAVLTNPATVKAQNLRRDPRLAISMTEAGNPYVIAMLRGRATACLDGDPAWAIADRISMKYRGEPYSRARRRVVMLISIDWLKSVSF